MFKKVFMIVVSMLLVGLLVGCSPQSSTSSGSSNNVKASHVISKADKAKKEKQDKINKAVKKVGASYTLKGLGKVTPIAFGYSDELGINGKKSAPNLPVTFGKSSVTISHIALVKIKPDEKGSELLDSVDPVSAYMVIYTVKNGYPAKMDFTPGGFSIKTSDGDGSDNVSTQFATVPANGTVKSISIIQLDSNSSEIPKKALLTVPAPTQYESENINVNAASLDDKDVSIQMLNVRQSVLKDHTY